MSITQRIKDKSFGGSVIPVGFAVISFLAFGSAIESALAQSGGALGETNPAGAVAPGQQPPTIQRRARPPLTMPGHDPADEVLHDGGLITVDLEIGDGEELKAGDVGIFDYSGWLAANGSVFITTRTPGREPLVMAVPGRLIDGWNVGLPGMHEGGQRKLIVPSGMGYGDKGYGRIGVPPNSDLVFDVKLVKVLRAPRFDAEKAEKLADGALFFDAKVGDGPAFAASGFGMFHVTSWTPDGAIKGTSYARDKPSIVSGDATKGWSTYALGMKQNGVRFVDAPEAMISDEQTEADSTETGERQWYVIEAIEVTAPIVQTPHKDLTPLELSNGIVAYDLKIGEGRVLPKYSMPHIQFTGWRADGTVYDTTLAPGASFRVVQPEFDLGFWQPVLEGMHIGGKRKAMIPASLAYDKDGSVEYRIGPNEDLVIEFEILSFEMPLFLPPDAELDAETQELMESGDFFNLGGDDENDDDGGEDDDDGG